jgi:hypothetical protein
VNHKRFLPPLLTLATLFATNAAAQESSPPLMIHLAPKPVIEDSRQRGAKLVKAVLVKSWGPSPVWPDLTQNWSKYGAIPLSVDDTSLINGDFTYAQLVASQADVIVISDAAGGDQQYSATEFAAIAKYAGHGHTILGTYLTLQNSLYDNRGLAPVFGFDPAIEYSTIQISNQFYKVAHACLLNRIPGSSWQSTGYDYSQLPADNPWNQSLGSSKAVAQSDSYNGLVSLYHGNNHTGIYITNMPEYEVTGGVDEQLLYNALTCYVKK